MKLCVFDTYSDIVLVEITKGLDQDQAKMEESYRVCEGCHLKDGSVTI